MDKLTILGMVHGFDIELSFSVDAETDIGAIVLAMKERGLSPRPRFQRDNAAFEPCSGLVEKIEDTKTKNDKPMFIAHVRPIVAEGEPQKELIAVKYLPPKSSFRIGDRVRVTKNDKGWLEINEDTEAVAPF